MIIHVDRVYRQSSFIKSICQDGPKLFNEENTSREANMPALLLHCFFGGRLPPFGYYLGQKTRGLVVSQPCHSPSLVLLLPSLSARFGSENLQSHSVHLELKESCLGSDAKVGFVKIECIEEVPDHWSLEADNGGQRHTRSATSEHWPNWPC